MLMSLLKRSSQVVPRVCPYSVTLSPCLSTPTRALSTKLIALVSSPSLQHSSQASQHSPLACVTNQAKRIPWIRVPASAAQDSVNINIHTSQQRNNSSTSTQPASLQAKGTSMPAVRDNIILTELEKELFDTLLAAAQRAPTPTTLRCAGGWVRDKLLGRDSLDIDIALDSMLGKEFAELVNQHLSSQGKEVRTAAVIQSNPEQSKHLETARLKISGLWIDLVNLRSETYAQGSRIPKMEFGTPEQDAMRRDFTINSLFYNINKGTVEDFTGRGLDDLRKGIIRTPLPPTETFLDDPLRVLRAVRFAARFACSMEQSVQEAAADEKVQAALGQKVSKERVGAELEGMFHGPSPVESMQLLQRLSLFPVVFALPPATQQALPADYAQSCVHCMATTHALVQAQGMQLDKEELRFLLFAALMLPLRACKVPGPKGKSVPASAAVVREAIKWRGKDADMAVLLHETVQQFLDVHHQLAAVDGSDAAVRAQNAPESLRVQLGTAIRRLKQHWRLGALLAPVLTIPEASPLSTEEIAKVSGARPRGAQADNQASAEEVARCKEVYSTLLAAAHAFGLEECWQWKPLLDGKQALALLELQKPGPVLGRATQEALNWQLVHPQGNAEECKQHVQAWWQKEQAS